MKHFRVAWILTLCACGLLFSIGARARTSIIVKANAQEIVVAADGKLIHQDGRPSETACKIAKVGSFFFAMSGFESQWYRLDPRAEARKAAAAKPNLFDAADLFETLMKPILSLTLLRMKGDYPDLYAYYRGNPLQVVFLGFENGSPKWVTITFVGAESQATLSITARKTRCPGQCNGDDTIYLGHRRAIDEARARDARLLQGPPEKVTSALVQLEIAAEPDTVGPPVSVLKLDATGEHWLQPGACAAPKE